MTKANTKTVGKAFAAMAGVLLLMPLAALGDTGGTPTPGTPTPANPTPGSPIPLHAPSGAQPTTEPLAPPTAPSEVKPVPSPSVDADSAARRRDLVGAKVMSVDDKVSGEIEDIVFRDGRHLVVVGYGGILGIGATRVAIPAADIDLVEAGTARVTLTDAQIKGLPEFDG